MARTIIGVVCGFGLGFGCAFLLVGKGAADEPRTDEEMADAQQRAQEKVDRAERQMQKEKKKNQVYVRDRE